MLPILFKRRVRNVVSLISGAIDAFDFMLVHPFKEVKEGTLLVSMVPRATLVGKPINAVRLAGVSSREQQWTAAFVRHDSHKTTTVMLLSIHRVPPYQQLHCVWLSPLWQPRAHSRGSIHFNLHQHDIMPLRSGTSAS